MKTKEGYSKSVLKQMDCNLKKKRCYVILIYLHNAEGPAPVKE